jgi:hypothetical protein
MGRRLDDRTPITLRRLTSRPDGALHTSPKRQRGETPSPRWRLGLVLPAELAALGRRRRWIVETFFKLFKGGGQQLEHWRQEDGVALLKRLLAASMPCVPAWRLRRGQAPQADEARRVVISLSGRQVEHGKKFTLEGLLAGAWVLLAMAALLKETPAAQVRQMADFVLNGSVQTSAQPATRRDAG